jgi:hypothetical protein
MRNRSEIALFEFSLSLFSFVDLTMTEAEITLLLQEGKQKLFIGKYSGESFGSHL